MTLIETRKKVRAEGGCSNKPFGEGTHTKIGLAALQFLRKLDGASPAYDKRYRYSK